MPIQSSQVNPGALRNDYSGFAEAGRIKGQMYANLGGAIKSSIAKVKEKRDKKAQNEAVSQIAAGILGPKGVKKLEANGTPLSAIVQNLDNPEAFLKTVNDIKTYQQQQQVAKDARAKGEAAARQQEFLNDRATALETEKTNKAALETRINSLQGTIVDNMTRIDSKDRTESNMRSMMDQLGVAAQNRGAVGKLVRDTGIMYDESEELDLRIKKQEFSDNVLLAEKLVEEKASTQNAIKTKAATKMSTGVSETIIVADEIQKALKILETPRFQTGLMGMGAKKMVTEDMEALQGAYTTIQSHVMRSRMLALKEASSTGATGFGAMNAKEFESLTQALGSMREHSSVENQKGILKNIQNTLAYEAERSHEDFRSSYPNMKDDEVNNIYKRDRRGISGPQDYFNHIVLGSSGIKPSDFGGPASERIALAQEKVDALQAQLDALGEQ